MKCPIFDVWGIDFMGPFPISNGYSYIMLVILLHKYGVVHRVATTYHPQTNGQVEKTLQKMTNPSQKDWNRLLEDALWAHRTAYQTLLGMSPYQIVFGKAYHLPVEIEHRAY
ncbi:hypothetical protein CR513_31587, partial [Mucuna pruriens]